MTVKIENVNQAVELIVEKMKSLGFRATKMKNYGYYSFALKTTSFNDAIINAFSNSEYFNFSVVTSYLEYKFKIIDLDLTLVLKYESSRSNSKLVLELDI